MTYIVNDNCIMSNHTDCVEVCPVDCFYEGENMLVINPDECIECDAWAPACPPDAIYEDEDTCISYEGNDESVKKNYEFFGQEWDG